MRDRSVAIDEYSRGMICQEEQHVAEVDKMLRKPGGTGTSTATRAKRKR